MKMQTNVSCLRTHVFWGVMLCHYVDNSWCCDNILLTCTQLNGLI